MKCMSRKSLSAVLIGLLVLLTAGIAVADIILYPGYISGAFSIGNFNVYSGNVSASGGGHSSSKSVTGNAYTLTVQGGDWDYNVNASLYLRPVDAYYPYTYMVFNPRTINVPVGQTVQNDYSFPNAPIVRFRVNITGDAYNSWWASGYAVQYVPPPAERTYSRSYTSSYYSPGGSWDMPVVPNDNVRIYAYVRVDTKYYYFWTSSPDLRYEALADGDELVLDLNIVHNATVPDPPDPPTYEYGTVQGTVEMTLLDPSDFVRHYVRGRSATNVYFNHDNLGTYQLNYELAGRTYTYWARTYFGSNQGYLTWPYTDGDYTLDQIYIEPNQVHQKDFFTDTGVLTGDLAFTGTLDNNLLNYYQLRTYGASDFYNPATNVWERQKTYGGYSYFTKPGTDPDITYRFNLTPGPWLPRYVTGSHSDYDSGYYNSFSFSFTDYTHHYDGNYYDFGQPTTVNAGEITVEDREYCMGSVVIRFRDDAGGLLSSPTVRGTANQYNENNKRVLYASLYGSSGVQNVLTPEAELHGPPADYTLSSLQITAQDGTRISFPAFPITFECGVRKGVPSSGVPLIVINSPHPNLITNAASVTISGTAADDTGIAGVSINGTPVAYTPTGNPDNEVAFSEVITLVEGINTILTEAVDPEDNLSYDERDVYVDRWVPTVSIDSPADGTVYLPGASVPVQVNALDQGYGFTLQVYVSGSQTVLCDIDGAANDLAAELVTCSASLTATLDDQVIIAQATDLAGNTASASVTIHGNSPPTVEAGGPYSVNEGGSVTLTAAGSDPENGPLTYAWDLDNNGSFETPGQSATFSATSIDGPATRSVAVEVTDNGGLTATDQALITILNVAPAVDAGPDATINEAGTFASSGSFTDPGADTWSATVDYGDGSGVQPLTLTGMTFSLSHTYADDGAYTVTVTVTDDDAGVGSDTAVVTVQNVAPTVNAGPDATINEAGTFASSGSFSDPGADTWSATVDYGDGSGVQPLTLTGMTFSLSHTYADDGAYTVTVTVTDDDAGVGSDTAVVTVLNVAPTVGEITAPVDPTGVDTVIEASAPFTDPGVLDTHTAEWDWGDGTTSEGAVVETNGSGTASGSHAYLVAGVYTITLTVTDKDGDSGQSVFEYVVVYDPSEGFVTGGGWIDSPAGAYVSDPALTGKANFGFVSKYKKGTTEPTGNTQFNFKAASLNFHSSDYQWLVVAGSKAKFKGNGTINGAGNYGFMISATDGELDGSGVDKLRLKIWDEATGTVVYDNQMGAADDADATDAIEGGSIVIHSN